MKLLRASACSIVILAICSLNSLAFGDAVRTVTPGSTRPTAKAVTSRNAYPKIILVAAQPARVASVVQSIGELGARVVSQYDDVGFIEVDGPERLAKRIELIRGVDVVQVTEGGIVDCLPTPRPLEVDRPATTLPQTAFRQDEAFVPLVDVGIKELRAAHPTFDGRGIGIAVMEGCERSGEVIHPSLSSAKSLEGRPLPKFAGVIDPALTRKLNFRGVPLRHRVNAIAVEDTDRDGKLLVGTSRYHAPSAGRWNFGQYTSFAGEKYNVLWSENCSEIRVDTDNDGGFSNNRVLHDINIDFRADRLSTPKTNISFFVACAPDKSAVYIYESGEEHKTMEYGLVAGHDLLGKRIESAAPNAQIFIGIPYYNEDTLLEAYIQAARDPRINIITTSYAATHYRSVVGVILDRIVERYGVIIIRAAGNNGPALETLPWDDDNAKNFLGVGASISAPTALAYYGLRMPLAQNVTPYSSLGPTVGGRILPDLLAPSSQITTSQCPPTDDGFRLGHFTFPPCYMLSGGTSASAPAAAGAIAALLSGLKQSGKRLPNGPTLLWALRYGAHSIASASTPAQGYGVLDVDRSWSLLQRKLSFVRIDVEAPVASVDAPAYYPEGAGSGLYEREGWFPGKTGNRSIGLTRRTGPKNGKTFDLRWRGSKPPAFDAPSTISLPLNRQAHLRIKIHPKSFGVQSGILEVIDRRTRLGVQSIQIAVIAAHQVSSGSALADTERVTWPAGDAIYFHVPQGNGALKVTIEAHSGTVLAQLASPSPEKDRHLKRDRPEIEPHSSKTFEIDRPIEGVYALNIMRCDFSTANCAEHFYKKFALQRDVKADYRIELSPRPPTSERKSVRPTSQPKMPGV
jgi:hypothetical protein